MLVKGGLGANEFFYLSKDKADQWGIEGKYLEPTIPSSRNSVHFTFDRKDWATLLKDEVAAALHINWSIYVQTGILHINQGDSEKEGGCPISPPV